MGAVKLLRPLVELLTLRVEGASWGCWDEAGRGMAGCLCGLCEHFGAWQCGSKDGVYETTSGAWPEVLQESFASVVCVSKGRPSQLGQSMAAGGRLRAAAMATGMLSVEFHPGPHAWL